MSTSSLGIGIYRLLDRSADHLDIPGFTRKPILSDEAAAFQADASGISGPHFLCDRQLLEGFGSRILVGRIANALLYSATKQAYERRVPRADLLTQHFKNIGRVPEIAVPKFSDLFGEVAGTSADRFEAQALRTRSQFGATICSNHVERLHRELSAAVAGSGSLSSRLTTSVKVLKNGWSRPASSRPGKHERSPVK
jgi:hypothetical protein